MARTIRSRSGIALAGVVLVAGVSACGSDGDVSEAASETSTQAKEEVAVTEPGGEVSAEELVQRLKSPGEEALSSFEFTAEVAEQQEQLAISGAVNLQGETPAAQVTMDVPPMGTLDLLLVEGVAYVNVPELTPAGKYFEVPAQELADFGVSDVSSTLDVDALMQDWESSAQKITFVGAEEIDGATTDHYEVLLDPEAALDAAGQTAPPDIDLSGSLSYGIWVGDDDLIRQMVVEIDGSSATVSMDQWGQDVDVQAPDPADVMELPNF